MHCPYYGACRDEMQEEEGRILLIVMRRTFPFEPIEPAEPFPVVITGRHAPWANPEPFLYVIIRTILYKEGELMKLLRLTLQGF